jgi:hypothetical protein
MPRHAQLIKSVTGRFIAFPVLTRGYVRIQGSHYFFSTDKSFDTAISVTLDEFWYL